MNISKIIGLVVFQCLCISSVSSQSLNAKISLDTVLLGNSYRLSVDVVNLDGDIDMPSLDDLGNVSGPSTQISSQYINGQSSSQEIYTYSIRPLNEGNYIIPQISLTTKDTLYMTDVLSVVVLENPEGIIQQESNESSSYFFNQPIIPSRPPVEKPYSSKDSSSLKKKLKRI